MPTNPLPPEWAHEDFIVDVQRGDDEELKGLLEHWRVQLDHVANGSWPPRVVNENGARQLLDTFAAVESLFSRIREERDRLIKDAKYAEADIEALKAQRDGLKTLLSGSGLEKEEKTKNG